MALVQKKTLNELATNASDDFFGKRFSAGDEVPHSGSTNARNVIVK